MKGIGHLAAAAATVGTALGLFAAGYVGWKPVVLASLTNMIAVFMGVSLGVLTGARHVAECMRSVEAA